MEEDYEDEYDDEEDDESSGMLLRISDGKAEIYHPEDYVEMTKGDAELMKKFIDENKELFDKFIAQQKTKQVSSNEGA